ncbi:MAG: polysaccharide pyruvyl transferase family protein [Acidimicrobiales bacterium]
MAGWFSFPEHGATAGDLLVRDLACEWLGAAGRSYDIANASPFPGGVDWRIADVDAYSDVVFVCGPFPAESQALALLRRFRGARHVGLNLSMLEGTEGDSGPFDVLFERDSPATARPDLAFLASPALVPVVGLVLVDPQHEYGTGRYQQVDEAFRQLAEQRPMARVIIDTRLDISNRSGLGSPGEIESAIARMDVVLTTRLHGTVFALKHGVPPVVVDPIPGGAKVQRHAQTVGWPASLTVDALDHQVLLDVYDYCLTPEARDLARGCAKRAVETVFEVRSDFIAVVSNE